MAAVIGELTAVGARLARPGEFTLRAFLAGRLDLLQAEGILGVIEANDRAALDRAINQRTGGLSRPITDLRGQLLDLLADLEAGLDFVDEGIEFVSPQQLQQRLIKLAGMLDRLTADLRDRSLAGQRPRIVLTGPANAGKSTLFNALVGKSRALVDEHAGTTRDYLSADLDLGGRIVELIDTAGFDRSTEPIASLAGTMRQQVVVDADLRVGCLPADKAINQSDDVPSCDLFVVTKQDLEPSIDLPPADCRVSAILGTGLNELRAVLAAKLAETEQRQPPDRHSDVSERCRESLHRGLTALQDAIDACRASAGHEIIAVALRDALDSLGEVVGAVYTNDLLDRVFSRFCIGK